MDTSHHRRGVLNLNKCSGCGAGALMNSIRRPADLTRRFRIVALALVLGGLISSALPAGAQLALTAA